MAVRFTTLAALFLAACPDRPVAAVPIDPQPQVVKDVVISTKLEVDILFVIDDSGSMGNEQTSLRASFPQFMAVFENVVGGLPDVHIGVVSSDMGTRNSSYCASNEGDDGQLQNGDGNCPIGSARFISDAARPDGTRERNYSGTLEDAFSCIADLGDDGCGFEQHLASMQRALARPDQQDFLRKDALLAVIIIADEDDCSIQDATVLDPSDETEGGPLGPPNFRCTEWGVQCEGAALPRAEGTYADCQPREASPYLYEPKEYVDYLTRLKGRDKVMMAAIAGTLQPFKITRTPFDVGGEPGLHLDYSCEGSDTSMNDREGAVPPVRIKALLDGFADSVLGEICGDELSGSLEVIAEKLARRLGNTCVPANADVADVFPDRVGVQPECSVVEVVDDVETVVARCDMVASGADFEPALGNTLPCWWIRPATSEECTGGETHLILVERDGPPPATATLRMSCAGRTGEEE